MTNGVSITSPHIENGAGLAAGVTPEGRTSSPRPPMNRIQVTCDTADFEGDANGADSLYGTSVFELDGTYLSVFESLQ
jgi:hypothetical protein